MARRKSAGKKVHRLSGQGPWLVGAKEEDDEPSESASTETPQQPQRLKSGKSAASSGGRASGGSRDDLLADRDLLEYEQGCEDAALDALSEEELLSSRGPSAVSMPSMPSLTPSRSTTMDDGEEERMRREWKSQEQRWERFDNLWQQLNDHLHAQEELYDSQERRRLDSLSAEEWQAWEDDEKEAELERLEHEALMQQQMHAVREQHEEEEEMLLQMGEELGEGEDDDDGQPRAHVLQQPAPPARQVSSDRERTHQVLDEMRKMMKQQHEFMEQLQLQNQQLAERQELEARRERAQEEVNRRIERRLKPKPWWRQALWWLVRSTWKHALWVTVLVLSHVVRSWWDDSTCASPPGGAQAQLRVAAPDYEL